MTDQSRFDGIENILKRHGDCRERIAELEAERDRLTERLRFIGESKTLTKLDLQHVAQEAIGMVPHEPKGVDWYRFNKADTK